LRAAVVETHTNLSRFHVATDDDCHAVAQRRRVTSIVWTRNCSALAIFALNGVALKSASTRTMFARSSATMGLA
jgi:hypothetical protein